MGSFPYLLVSGKSTKTKTNRLVGLLTAFCHGSQDVGGFGDAGGAGGAGGGGEVGLEGTQDLLRDKAFKS